MGKKIVFTDHNDAMKRASARSRETFKYFWREVSWEKRRIIPAMDLYAVKLPLNTNSPGNAVPKQEHVWFSGLEYNGENITGELVNEPFWVRDLKAGDKRSFKLSDISDWMYVMGEEFMADLHYMK